MYTFIYTSEKLKTILNYSDVVYIDIFFYITNGIIEYSLLQDRYC